MSTDDPFSSPPPQRDQQQPPAAPEWQPNGPAAPGYSTAPQTAPGFAPATPVGQPYATQPYATQPYATQPNNGGAPGYGQQQPAATTTDGPSIAALVTGVLGLNLVAIALGAIGLRRTAGGKRKGTWMAVVGIVLGVLGTIVATAAITWSTAAASSLFDSDVWGERSSEFFDSDAGYGDDPELDALWDACEAGDDAACDDLWTAAPLGSDYSDFGDSCGERGRPFTQAWCEEGRDW